MQNILIVETIDPLSNEPIRTVVIKLSDNDFQYMSESLYLEQQKAAELGGTL